MPRAPWRWHGRSVWPLSPVPSLVRSSPPERALAGGPTDLDMGPGRAGLLTVLKRGFGAALVVLLVAAGCGQQTVRMTPPEAEASTTEVCADLVSALPD